MNKYYRYIKKGRKSQVGELNSNYKPVEERFWKKVRKTGTCWLWTGAIDSWGYGQIKIQGKSKKASRLSYELHYGTIPVGLMVLHSCDRPICVNPNHLWLGSNTDNMQDMVKKGRNSDKTGEHNGNSKLKRKDIEKIRKMYNTGIYSKTEIGKLFLISGGHVGRIIMGYMWK